MTFAVIVQPRAKADVRRQVKHLIDHVSIDFAAEWAAQVDAAVASLRRMPERCGLANEAEDVGLSLRHLLFGDRPHVFRMLFVVRDRDVYVVRVRHSAQQPLARSDITLPRDDRR